ncbi:hypothetical protein [Burkholderia sp. Ac-20353]|uniref:hypothetical protein n=1 Tax=Burkholderia sp. Ac-20353 TaxID=2703894 RepID=UPI00197BEFBF|nr:hypothetical protein [Burkholderia sp. Ac-20353]MBN3785905.1 hypothetical protein [Burkholderia sp. Ac-20353]
MIRKTTRKHLRIAGAVTAATIALGVAGMIYALPSAAAAACPACYGFRQAGTDIYVQKQVGEAEQAAIVGMIGEARSRLTDFWGPLKATPRIFVCSDEACFRRMGGGRRRGMSLYDRVAVLSPRGGNVVIAAHELSMNELHHRVGPWAFATGRIPIWFDEGIAMVSSNDLRYLAPVDRANRCLVAPPADLPAGMFDWNRAALTDSHLYAKAACRTSEWMAAHGGARAAVAVVDQVAAGVPFEEAAR